jgi:serine/threonine protein phosphatase PrpC
MAETVSNINKISLRYKLSTFTRKGLGQEAGNLQIYPDTNEGISDDQWCISILIDEHNMDWSDEISVTEDQRTLSQLSDSFLRNFESYTNENNGRQTAAGLDDALLSSYQVIDAIAEREQIAASMLTACWLNDLLHIASVGVCRAYLLRAGRIKQLTVDDFTYITEDGSTYCLPNILTNSIGRGTIHNSNDIHLSTFKLNPHDMIILCNITFYKHVSEDEMLNAALTIAELDKICSTLGTKASQNTDMFDTVSLCLVKFE